jgi:putative restriction endonuclease
MVTDAYNRRCAVTRERIVPILVAGHIRPYSESGPHHVSNGVLLRSDVHTLFDLGYLTITPTYQLEVSNRIKEEYENGLEYYTLHGKTISMPSRKEQLPNKDYLEWHNQNVYVP